MGPGRLPGWLEGADSPGSASAPCRSSINVVGCPDWLWLLSVPLAQTFLLHTRAHTPSHTLMRPGPVATCCLKKLVLTQIKTSFPPLPTLS